MSVIHKFLILFLFTLWSVQAKFPSHGLSKDYEKMPIDAFERNVTDFFVTFVNDDNELQIKCSAIGSPTVNVVCKQPITTTFDGVSSPGSIASYVRRKRQNLPATRSQTVEFGSQAHLQCSIQNNNIKTSWRRSDGRPLPPDYNGTGILVIKNIKHDSAGQYECVADINLTTYTLARTDLIVTEPPRIKLIQPESVTIGDNFEIVCSVAGEQPIRVYWYKENMQPFPPSITVRGNALQFTNYASKLAGRYFCRAENVHGNQTGEISIVSGGNEVSGMIDGSNRKSELACDRNKEMVKRYRGNHGVLLQQSEFPWMAALGYILNEDYPEFACGGTIISNKYILTAAHCCVPYKPIIVQLGSNILNGTEKMNLLVESCIKHEQFSHGDYENDIALLKLDHRIEFSDRILPACLRTSSTDLPSNEDLVVTGWGITEEGNPSVVLKQTRLQTVDLRTCQADFQKNDPTKRINANHYCAADPNRLGDACLGDSGGPLQMFHGSPLATVVGITSFGRGCPSLLPGVYTRVASFLDWIEDKVWND